MLDFSSDSEEEQTTRSAPPPRSKPALVAEAKPETTIPAIPSKHSSHALSETVANELKNLYDEPEDLQRQTPIQNRYVFWFMQRPSGKASSSDWESGLVDFASFQTVEHFWRIYDHLARPSTLPSSAGQVTYNLFKNGIKPSWEDPNNVRGGAWIIRLKKGLASRFWEELVLAIVGEQFDVGNEICGAKLSVRFNEDRISLWHRNADNQDACNKIRDLMRRLLKLPHFIPIEYKRHSEHLGADKPQSRGSSAWRGQSDNKSSQPQHYHHPYHQHHGGTGGQGPSTGKGHHMREEGSEKDGVWGKNRAGAVQAGGSGSGTSWTRDSAHRQGGRREWSKDWAGSPPQGPGRGDLGGGLQRDVNSRWR